MKKYYKYQYFLLKKKKYINMYQVLYKSIIKDDTFFFHKTLNVIVNIKVKNKKLGKNINQKKLY